MRRRGSSILRLRRWLSRQSRDAGGRREPGRWPMGCRSGGADAGGAVRTASQMPGRRSLDVDTALTFQLHERYLAQKQPDQPGQRLGELAESAHGMRPGCSADLGRSRWSRTPRSLRCVNCVRNSPCTVATIPNGVDCSHNRPGLASAPAQRPGLQRQPDLQRELRRHALVPGRGLSPDQGGGPRRLPDHHRLYPRRGFGGPGAR